MLNIRLSGAEANYIHDFVIGAQKENSYKKVFTKDDTEKGISEERDYIILLDSFAVEGERYEFTIAGLGQFETGRKFTDVENDKELDSQEYGGKKDSQHKSLFHFFSL